MNKYFRAKRCIFCILLLTAYFGISSPALGAGSNGNSAGGSEWMFSLENAAITLAVLICIALPVAPVYVYVKSGWKVKRDEISDGLSTEARKCYLVMFSRSALQVDGESEKAGQVDSKGGASSDKIFENFYTTWYGRRHFALPIFLLLAVLAFVCIGIIISAAGGFPYWKPHDPIFYTIPKTAIAALAGAYLWVTSDFITRARRLDFSPSDIYWGVLRLVVAIPMGYAFAGLTSEVIGPFVAFGLGAFPLTAIQDILRQTVYKTTIQTSTAVLHNDAVTKLQGVDDEIANRLANEGITTIPQIAYCDPVRLVMRSHLTFNFVIDCMNQALSWVYFEDQLTVLRPLGLRGAVEIAYLMEALASSDPYTKQAAESTLKDVVSAIKPPHTEFTLRYSFEQIASDPYTYFLSAIWINPFSPKNGETDREGNRASARVGTSIGRDGRFTHRRFVPTGEGTEADRSHVRAA